MASPKVLLLISLSLILLLACGGGSAQTSPTSSPPTATGPTDEPSPALAPGPTTPISGPTANLDFSPSPGVTPDAALGKDLFQSYGCNACHSNDGTALVGPTWLGLYGTEEELEDGTAALVDTAYIVESIKDPNARITKGFTAGLMPATLGVSDDEILHIIEYMKALR